jgi:cell division protein FtsB
MLNTSQITSAISLGFTFWILYFTLLGNAGIFERNNLEAKLNNLKDEVERLENENKHLETRQNLLKNDDKALASEARKYYLLAENSRVIKFKESIETEGDEKIASTSLPVIQSKNKTFKNNARTIYVLKIFYIIVTSSIVIGVLFKLK